MASEGESRDVEDREGEAGKGGGGAEEGTP